MDTSCPPAAMQAQAQAPKPIHVHITCINPPSPMTTTLDTHTVPRSKNRRSCTEAARRHDRPALAYASFTTRAHGLYSIHPRGTLHHSYYVKYISRHAEYLPRKIPSAHLTHVQNSHKINAMLFRLTSPKSPTTHNAVHVPCSPMNMSEDESKCPPAKPAVLGP